MSLFAELKRRNVFRVGAAYVVIGWLLLQVADVLLDNFGAPDWVFKSFAALLILGLPLALFLAWAFELTPEGVKRAEDVVESDSITPRTGRRIDRLIVIGLLAVISVLVVERVWFAGAGSDAGTDSSAEPSVATVADDTRQTGAESERRSGAGAGGDLSGAAPGGDRPDAGPAAGPAAEKESIAVLPFANMSADPEQEFFADGITEDILTRLAAIGELRVISRTSIMRYKGSDKSLPEIAAELGVSHVLEGSVRRAGNQVRITGQLIRAADDAHLWAESFDRELADIFAVQTEIADHIVEALALQLTDSERERLQRQGTDNAAAYEQYLLGRAQLNQSYSDFDEIARALDMAEAQFRAALDKDPDYADAWAGLASALLPRLWVQPEQAEANYQAGVEAARRAIRLAPESAVGYVWLGRAYMARGLDEAAIEQFQLAAEIEPDSVDVLSAQAGFHRSEGRPVEAVKLLDRAVRIEPGDANLRDQLAGTASQIGELQLARDAYRVAWGSITPHEARLACMLAEVALQEGDAETARRHLVRARELEPDSPFQANCQLDHSLRLRDLDAVSQVFEREREFFEQRQPLTAALALARTQPDADLEPLLALAEHRLRETMPRRWGSNLEYTLARIELLRGNPAAALARLEAAIDLGWRSYRELELDITWDPVREDPSFQALAGRVDEDLARQRAELVAGVRQ
ncbi:tetratricopeptide repeat protein [Wenzhouxiangella sp. XN24]|uniref:TPR end-of-group domain-containing protein n=1 Tax=Wenzhouxiangella sp. XN24 TaxID=2713569 RepID=UPI0013ED02FD|nr:tetratricopeptide repeat protein [Wenzhouxiangella sp. XN24]NGX15818.1 tetratricopeptide repeat protein [Wenzhouxiangella sp. XN24]